MHNNTTDCTIRDVALMRVTEELEETEGRDGRICRYDKGFALSPLIAITVAACVLALSVHRVCLCACATPWR